MSPCGHKTQILKATRLVSLTSFVFVLVVSKFRKGFPHPTGNVCFVIVISIFSKKGFKSNKSKY